MQIHEITQKPVDEGILKGVATGLRAAAGMAAQNVLGQVKAATGVDIAPEGPSATSSMQRATMGDKLTRSLIRPTADKMAKDWDLTLNAYQKKYGDPGGPNWPNTDVEEEVDKMINRLMRTTNWQDFAQSYVGDPMNEKSAQIIQQRLADARNRILTTAPKKTLTGTISTSRDLATAWSDLVTAGFDAINLEQHDPSQARRAGGNMANVTFHPVTGVPLYDGRPFDPANPRHVAAKKALGIP